MQQKPDNVQVYFIHNVVRNSGYKMGQLISWIEFLHATSQVSPGQDFVKSGLSRPSGLWFTSILHLQPLHPKMHAPDPKNMSSMKFIMLFFILSPICGNY